MTQPEEELVDRTGYEVTEQGGTDMFGRPAGISFSVLRLLDHVGLGAYATQEDVDLIITLDRRHLETLATAQEAQADPQP